jgi:hypothetical protein
VAIITLKARGKKQKEKNLSERSFVACQDDRSHMPVLIS